MNILVKLSLLSLSVSVLTSCNPQEKFYDKSQVTSAFSESGVLVRDVVESGSGSNTCSQITSEEACKQAADCQGLYEELPKGGVKYLVCVQNPVDGGSTTGEGASGGYDPGIQAGGAGGGVMDPPKDGPSSGGGASSGGSSSGGSSSGGSSAGGSSAGGASSGGYSVDDHDDDNDDHDDDDHNVKGRPVKPSSPVIPRSCEQIGSEHKVLVGQNLKVKICHKAANGKEISIAVACPAVAAHQSHHDDKIGLCADDE